MERSRSCLGVELAPANLYDERRRLADVPVQESGRHFYEADMGRLQATFVTMRAQDRAAGILEMVSESDHNLCHLDATVHEGRLFLHISMIKMHAVELQRRAHSSK